MSAKTTRATRIGARVLAGVAGLAAAACVVGGVLTISPAGARVTPVARTVTPVPAAATAACPGPLLTVTSGTANDSLTSGSEPGTIAGGGTGQPTSGVLTTSGVQGAAAVRYFEQPAVAGRAPLLAAAQSAEANSAELSGLATANCAQPGYDSWLVGGGTSLGTTTLVVLSNPGDVAATVSLGIYDEQGLVAASGGDGIPVRPHSQHVVTLAGLAPNASATVVHVTSTGGAVSAVLQESQVTGITPQGMDWVSPTAAPDTHLLIPGAIIDTSALSAGTGSDASDGGVPVLRVLPVGDKGAKLTIGLKPSSGTKGIVALTATVDPGVVSEIPLDHVGAGDYTITVDSSVPIVGAVGTTTVNSKGTDFTWYNAAQPLNGAAAIPLAAGPGKQLHLVNTSGSAVKVAFSGPLSQTVTVPAGGDYVRAITTSGVLSTANAGGVYASVSYTGPGLLSSYVAYPAAAAAATVKVYGR